MMNNIIKKKLWSAIFMTLVVISLLVTSVVGLVRLLEDNKDSEAVLSGYIGGDTDISILKQDVVRTQEIQNLLLEWLLDPRDAVNLVTYVETISERAGLSPVIENLNAQKTIMVDDTESAALELIVQLKGSFEEVQTFLILMENIPYQSHLEDVRLQKIGQNGSDVWEILIQAIVYTKPQL